MGEKEIESGMNSLEVRKCGESTFEAPRREGRKKGQFISERQGIVPQQAAL